MFRSPTNFDRQIKAQAYRPTDYFKSMFCLGMPCYAQDHIPYFEGRLVVSDSNGVTQHHTPSSHCSHLIPKIGGTRGVHSEFRPSLLINSAIWFYKYRRFLSMLYCFRPRMLFHTSNGNFALLCFFGYIHNRVSEAFIIEPNRAKFTFSPAPECTGAQMLVNGKGKGLT